MCQNNCEVCNRIEPFWKQQIKGLIDFIRWQELGFIIILFTVFYIMFGWIGLIIASFVHYGMATMEGGATADAFNEYPEEEYSSNVCSAGIKNCKICNNEYSHEFNEKYDKENKKWYNIF